MNCCWNNESKSRIKVNFIQKLSNIKIPQQVQRGTMINAALIGLPVIVVLVKRKRSRDVSVPK